jgi:hypothetical protein
MNTTSRVLALCALTAALTACGDEADDYRAMTPGQVCALLPTDEANTLMKGITEDRLTQKEETSVDLPACRYGTIEGKPYLRVSIHQSSQVKDSEDVTSTKIADQQALQRPADTSCSVLFPLAEHLYLLTIVESWDATEETCSPAEKAAETAYRNLTR